MSPAPKIAAPALALCALLLVGCGQQAPVASPAPAPVVSASATPSPSATPTPVAEDADAADFLLEGTPGVFDAEGFWKGHYGFFTDDTKTVRCDLYIFSGDSGGVLCAITLGNEAQRSYTVPDGVSTDCDFSSANASDGYSLGINFTVFDSGFAGFTGCRSTLQRADPGLAIATKVLPENQTLRVGTDHEKYSCAVAAGVASCAEAVSGASIRFGTAVAQYQG